MLHHDIACFQCGPGHRTGYIIRPSCLKGSFIYHVDGKNRSFDCLGMRVEYYCVSCRYHAHAVAQDGFTGIGAGSNGSDNAKGPHLDQGKSSVSRPCRRCYIFRSGGFVRQKVML